MIRVKFVAIFTTLFLLVACEQTADLTSTETYQKAGIQFSYPGNWRVAEDQTSADVRYIIVETPGDAIFIVQIYSRKDAVELKEYAQWASDQAKKQMSAGERTPGEFLAIEKQIDKVILKGIKENFSIKLFNEEVPHRSEYYKVDGEQKVAYLISQTAIEDLSKVQGGFDLLLHTFSMN